MESEAGGWRVRQGGWRVRQKGVESDIDGGRRVGQRGYEELDSWQRGDGECGLTLHPLPHSPPPPPPFAPLSTPL